jgi:hypothetical protein
MDGFFLNNNKMANEKQIKEWKEQYGNVYELPVEDKVVYLRQPKMVDYKRAFTAMQKNGEISFGEEMLACLVIGGDEEIKTNDEYFLPAKKVLTEFFNYDDAEINPVEGTNNSEIIVAGSKCLVRIITRNDIKIAEKKNPSGKPFVTQEKLFEMVCLEMDEAFKDKNNPEFRFPLYQAIEQLQNKKIAILKKL